MLPIPPTPSPYTSNQHRHGSASPRINMKRGSPRARLSPRRGGEGGALRRLSRKPMVWLMLLIPCLLWMMRAERTLNDEARRSNTDGVVFDDFSHRTQAPPRQLNNHRAPAASAGVEQQVVYSTDEKEAEVIRLEATPGDAVVEDVVLPENDKSREDETPTDDVAAVVSTDLLSDLDPAQNPLLPRSVYEPKSATPISVIYIGSVANATDPDDDLIFLDALQRSRYTQVQSVYLISGGSTPSNFYIQHEQWQQVTTTATPLVIVVDWSSSLPHQPQRDCHVLQRILTEHIQEQDVLATAYLLFLDSTASARTVSCPLLPIQADRIRIAKRSVVEGRYWNHTAQWVEPGNLIAARINNNNQVLHLPGHVSEEYLNQLRHVLENKERPLDVVHYWQSSENMETSLYYKRLRQRVSVQLNATQKTLAAKQTKNASAKFVDRVGVSDEDVDVSIELDISGDEESDSTNDKELAVTTLHIALLASTKIVVVTQNDEWEDHDNRLMEALAGGAMVLADRMQAPPAGLKDKTNIVFFDSTADLDRLVQYYLRENEKREAIARHGVQFALGRHRSWHVLESLLFGKALTRTDKGYEVGPPKRERTAHSQQGEADVL